MASKGGKRIGAGRKKGFAALEAEKARELIAKKLAKHFEPIVNMAILQATNGNKDARDWLTDRAFGKSVQPVDLNSKIVFDDEVRNKGKQAVKELIGEDIRQRGQKGN